MQRAFMDLLEENPIVAAVKSRDELDACLHTDCCVVFVLFGNLIEIAGIVDAIRSVGKTPIVHVDLIDGLTPREVTVDYIQTATGAAGIISTKAGLVRYAKSRGLIAVQRFFILDSISLQNASRAIPTLTADAVEILPGIMPKVIRELVSLSPKPIIAGGLISDKEDILAALDAGASAISTTNRGAWTM